MIKLKKSIAGVDEVGRGCLAGPVCSAAVILKPNFDYSFLNDSKKLAAPKRKVFNDIILKNSKSIGIGICSPKEIDTLNIREATFLSMKKALSNLNRIPFISLIDGNGFKSEKFNYKCIIRGDNSIPEIMAASIVAKVYRDSLMKYYSIVFPDYGFDKHKGYGTKIHFESLKQNLASIIHRKTFKPVYNHLSLISNPIKKINELVGVNLIENNYKIISFHKIQVDGFVLYLYVTFKVVLKLLICNYIDLTTSDSAGDSILEIIKRKDKILEDKSIKNINIAEIDYLSSHCDNNRLVIQSKHRIL